MQILNWFTCWYCCRLLHILSVYRIDKLLPQKVNQSKIDGKSKYSVTIQLKTFHYLGTCLHRKLFEIINRSKFIFSLNSWNDSHSQQCTLWIGIFSINCKSFSFGIYMMLWVTRSRSSWINPSFNTKLAFLYFSFHLINNVDHHIL